LSKILIATRTTVRDVWTLKPLSQATQKYRRIEGESWKEYIDRLDVIGTHHLYETKIATLERQNQEQVVKIQALERHAQDQRTKIDMYANKVQAQVSTLEKAGNVQEETEKPNLRDANNKTEAIEISTMVQRTKMGKILIIWSAISNKRRRWQGVGGKIDFDARSVRFQTLTFTKVYTIMESNKKAGVKRAVMLDLLSHPELTNYVDEIQRFLHV
jgi:hypothetical protein